MSKPQGLRKGKLKATKTSASNSVSCKPASTGQTLREAPATVPLAVATGHITPVSLIIAPAKDISLTRPSRCATANGHTGLKKASSMLKDTAGAPSLTQKLPYQAVNTNPLPTDKLSSSQTPTSLVATGGQPSVASADGSNLLQLIKNASRVAEDHQLVSQSGSQGPHSSSSTKRLPLTRNDLITRHLGLPRMTQGESARKVNESRSTIEARKGHKGVSEVGKQAHSVDPPNPIAISTTGTPKMPTPKKSSHFGSCEREIQSLASLQPSSAQNSGMQDALADVPTQLAKRIESLARELSCSTIVEVSPPITPPPSPPPAIHVAPNPEPSGVPGPTVRTSREALDRLVIGSTNVRFGDGLAVEMVTTPFEPTRVVVSGISPKVSWQELGRYLQHPEKVIHHELRSEDPESSAQTARIRFAHHQEAANAVRELDGHPGLATDSPLLAQYDTSVAPNLTSINVVADRVIVRWHIPSAKLRMYYRSTRVAREEVDVINKRTFCGRQLRAHLRANQHVVIIEGLSRDADINEIKRRHSPDQEPVFLENHYNHPLVMAQMKDFFQTAHPRLLDIKETEQEVTMHSNFHSQNDAESFLRTFRGHHLPWRASARLCVIHSWDLVYVMHVDKYYALQASIEDLAVKLQQVEIRLRVLTPPGHVHYRHIRVRGGHYVKSYKPMIDAILAGVAVARDDKPLWDADLEYMYGPQLFSDLGLDGVHVFLDRPRQRIMLLGAEDRRATATHRIFRRFDEAKRRLFVHTFPRWQLRYFLNAVEQILVPQFGRTEVLLDTRTCKITVGGVAACASLKAIVSGAPTGNSHVQAPEDTGPHCPVCLDMSSDPIRLPCQHRFCKPCLTRYLLSGTHPDAVFPMRCFGNEGRCNLAIPLGVIRRLLSSDEFDLATTRSLKLYVDSKPLEYHHCPTSDCPQVFRVSPQKETPESAQHCPGCLNKFCPACFFEGGHDGITCANALENQKLALVEETQKVEGWVRDLGGRTCPNCKMGLIKDGGCAHVQCSKCKVHICWTCGKTFDQVADESVYEHMRREHGSIGLIDWEVEDWNANNTIGWWEPPVIPPQSSGSSAGSPATAQTNKATNGAATAKKRRHRAKGGGKNHKLRAERYSGYSDEVLSEDEDDDFGGGKWDYDFADVNWESL